MSKTRLFALLLFGIMVAAILTNPKEEEFQDTLKEKAKSMLQKQLKYEDKDALNLGMTLFGDRIVQEFVQNYVVVENYYLFSLIKIKWQGEKTPIGGGAFKNIWISPKIDEKADEIVGVLKNL